MLLAAVPQLHTKWEQGPASGNGRFAEADVEATSLVEIDEDHFVATANGSSC